MTKTTKGWLSYIGLTMLTIVGFFIVLGEVSDDATILQMIISFAVKPIGGLFVWIGIKQTERLLKNGELPKSVERWLSPKSINEDE